MIRLLKSMQTFSGKSPLAMLKSVAEEAFIVVKLSNQKGSTSQETLGKLLAKLTVNASPFNNLRVNDAATGIHDRILAADGWYFPTIVGCRIPISVKTKELHEGVTYEATMYISPLYRDKLDEILLDINPIDYTEPKIYTFSSNDTIFASPPDRIINETYSGRVDLIYAKQPQLIDPKLYQRFDGIFNRLTTDGDWYRQVGRQRRETFMLYGPPGTGKTSLVRHFAAKYRMNIVIAVPGRNLNAVRVLMSQRLHTQPTIILFEDIDAHRCLHIETPDDTKRTTRFMSGSDDGDYSEFLNFLDGVRPLNNVVVVMTTNYIQKLKDAIYRSGRVNHLIELSYPSFETVVDNIGFKEGDSRLDYLRNLETKHLPLDSIVSLRSSETLSDVIEIIEARDHYFTLSEESDKTTTNLEDV